jgi:hypothetical protein
MGSFNVKERSEERLLGFNALHYFPFMDFCHLIIIDGFSPSVSGYLPMYGFFGSGWLSRG